MYALLPGVVIVVTQVLAYLPRIALIGFTMLAIGQWALVNAVPVNMASHLAGESNWLLSLRADASEYEELGRIVYATSDEKSGYYNIVGVEYPWLNANSASFFAAKRAAQLLYFPWLCGKRRRSSHAPYRRAANTIRDYRRGALPKSRAEFCEYCVPSRVGADSAGFAVCRISVCERERHPAVSVYSLFRPLNSQGRRKRQYTFRWKVAPLCIANLRTPVPAAPIPPRDPGRSQFL